MASPYPKALRERVVKAYYRSEGTYAELAARFNVGEASVNRWISANRRRGTVEPLPMGGARRERIVTPEGEAFLRQLVQEQPTLSLPQMADIYEEKFGFPVRSRLIGVTLRRLGITKKKRSDDPRRLGVLMWNNDEKSG